VHKGCALVRESARVVHGIGYDILADGAKVDVVDAGAGCDVDCDADYGCDV